MEHIKLSVRLFGEFSIKSPHYEFHPGATNSSQLTLLVTYLITNCGFEISKDKLAEILWPEETIKNQTASLRNLVYRARKELKKLYPDEAVEYIGFINNCYFWNTKISCNIDIVDFEHLYRKAEIETDKDKKFSLLSKMHQLYKGEFLPTFTSIEWVLYQNIYYRNMFINCTLNMCAYLYENNAFNELISLCDRSCLMYQEEERFHRYKLMAYLALDLPSAALEYYHSTFNFFSQKFGIDISESMKDIYHEILLQMPNMRLDMDELEEDLKESDDSNRTFYCNFDIFRNFYQINRRSVRRSHSKHYLLLLTLDDPADSEIDSDKLKEEMGVMFEVLSTCLRKNDIYTRTSQSQYSVILTVPNEYGSEVAASRISEKYGQKKLHPDMILTIERKLIE